MVFHVSVCSDMNVEPYDLIYCADAARLSLLALLPFISKRFNVATTLIYLVFKICSIECKDHLGQCNEILITRVVKYLFSSKDTVV